MFLLSHCRVKMTTKFGLVLVCFITRLVCICLKRKQYYLMFATFLSQFVKYGEMSKNIMKHKILFQRHENQKSLHNFVYFISIRMLLTKLYRVAPEQAATKQYIKLPNFKNLLFNTHTSKKAIALFIFVNTCMTNVALHCKWIHIDNIRNSHNIYVIGILIIEINITVTFDEKIQIMSFLVYSISILKCCFTDVLLHILFTT